MKQASRYFDLIIMILIGVVGLFSTISSIAAINDLNMISSYFPEGRTLNIIIWIVNLLLSIGFIAECVFAILLFRKGNTEKVSKAVVDTFTFYGGMCFIASILSICFVITVENAHGVSYTISSSAIFQMIWCLVIAIVGVIFSVKKVDGKKIPYYISIPSLSGGVLVALVCNVNANQSGLGVFIFILFIITSIAGIVLPLLKKFYPYEDRDNNHVTNYESVNSKPINTSNDYATKLRELKKLHDEGILDDEEYRVAKERIINEL